MSAITKAVLITIRNIFDNGFLTSSTRQVSTVEDLNGSNSCAGYPAYVVVHRPLASPSSVSYNELYSALQTRVVEGQENPLALFGTGKLFEVQKYCTLSNHCWSGFWIVAHSRAMTGF